MDEITKERELELIDGMIEVQLHHATQCDGIANRKMAEKQKGWDMERVALLRKMRAALAAQPAEPVAWINRRVIYDPATDSVTEYGEPELSFERASYGYDYANAKPLILAQQPAEAQPSPARELVAWKHDCAGLCANDVELWLDACPHCGKPRTTPPAQPAHTDGLAAEVWAIAQSPAPMADVLPVIAAALWASQPTEQALQKIADFGQDQEQQRPPHDPRR